jgi:cobalt/nickel transport system ATP-binding protein
MELYLDNVYYIYPGSDKYALKELSYRFVEGRTYLITGPNGAGKTTLLLVSSGLLKPVKGDVLLDKVSIYGKIEYRKIFGVLFQNPDLMLFNPTVYDEVTYSIKQINSDLKSIDREVGKWLKFFELDRSILDKQVYTLSYGYKKIVALVSILIYGPKILMLDEPHTNLAKKYFNKIKEIISINAKNGGINIVASHSTSIYKDIADYIIMLNNGSIIKSKKLR